MQRVIYAPLYPVSQGAVTNVTVVQAGQPGYAGPMQPGYRPGMPMQPGAPGVYLQGAPGAYPQGAPGAYPMAPGGYPAPGAPMAYPQPGAPGYGAPGVYPQGQPGMPPQPYGAPQQGYPRMLLYSVDRRTRFTNRNYLQVIVQ